MNRVKNQTNSVQTHSKFEPLLVSVVLITILLPVRVLFTTYVSTDWFSSFGLIFVISIALIVLVKKNKLGKFGIMFQNQMLKLQKGKRGIAVYGYVICMIFFLSLLIIAVHQGNSEFIEYKEILLSELNKSEEFRSFSIPDVGVDEWFFAVLNFFIQLILGTPEMYAAMAVLNDAFDGWPLHFYTVALVESLEIFGIMIFYKVMLPRTMNKKSTSS